jgi:hypothetical protein
VPAQAFLVAVDSQEGWEPSLHNPFPLLKHHYILYCCSLEAWPALIKGLLWIFPSWGPDSQACWHLHSGYSMNSQSTRARDISNFMGGNIPVRWKDLLKVSQQGRDWSRTRDLDPLQKHSVALPLMSRVSWLTDGDDDVTVTMLTLGQLCFIGQHAGVLPGLDNIALESTELSGEFQENSVQLGVL